MSKINLKNVTSNPNSLTNFKEVYLTENSPIEDFKILEGRNVLIKEFYTGFHGGVFEYYNNDFFLLSKNGKYYKYLQRLWVEEKKD